jgi:hypothetical protein
MEGAATEEVVVAAVAGAVDPHPVSIANVIAARITPKSNGSNREKLLKRMT